MQTRKWTDQSGQERYTTEVVIGRFKGELVLLDSNRGEEGGTEFGRLQPRPAARIAPDDGGRAKIRPLLGRPQGR